MDTRFESGLPTDVRQLPEGDELELIERSICALQLVKGSEESARTISWRHAQKAEPVAPPVPRKPSRHVPVDPTTATPRFLSKTSPMNISDLAQGDPEDSGPALK